MTNEVPSREQDPGGDCREAVSLGAALLSENGLDPALYKLVSAENLIKGAAHAGPQVWRLTFKLRRLIPETPEAEVGAGGDVFVEADLGAGSARLLGYGE